MPKQGASRIRATAQERRDKKDGASFETHLSNPGGEARQEGKHKLEHLQGFDLHLIRIFCCRSAQGKGGIGPA